jgi:hypothetical protein
LTALLLVTRELDVQPGEWLLQTAAGSTVGRLVIQLARHLGIPTINVVRRRDAVEEIKALGGDEVICTEDEDLLQRVAEIAGPAGVRKAIDCVAGHVGAQVSQGLAPGGEVEVYGALSTHRQTDPAALTIPLQARSVIYEAKAVRGYWLNRWFGTASPADALRALSEVCSLIADEVLSIRKASRSRSNASLKPSRSPKHPHMAANRSSSSKTARTKTIGRMRYLDSGSLSQGGLLVWSRLGADVRPTAAIASAGLPLTMSTLRANGQVAAACRPLRRPTGPQPANASLEGVSEVCREG